MNLFWVFKHRTAAINPRFAPAAPFKVGGLRLTVWITFLTLLIFVLWSLWASLDQITRAPGSVIASSRTQIIQSQEGGTIADLLVKEGDTVEAGQVLLQFEKVRFETSYLEARAKAAGLAATVARLQAEVLGTELKFPPELKNYPEFKESQLMLFKKRQAAIREDISALDGMIALVDKELAMTQPLLKTGDVINASTLKSSPTAAVEVVARVRAGIVAQEVKIAAMRGYLTESAPEVKQAMVELSALRAQLANAEKAEPQVEGQSNYVERYRNFKYHETLFELFAKQYELARVDEGREGAVVQVVDAAQPPERKAKPQKALIAILATLATGFAFLLIVLIRHALRNASQNSESAKKIQVLQASWRKALGR